MKKIIVLLTIVLILTTAVSAQKTNLDVTLLNQDPDPAGPGDYVKLRWKVINLGTEQIENLKFSLEEKYPLIIDSSNNQEQDVGTLIGLMDEQENYYTLYYKVRIAQDALEDTYDLVLKYSYDFKGQKIVQTKKFDLRVDDDFEPMLSIGNIITSPVKLLPDTQENKLQVDIINTGSGTAENVDATLVLPDGFEATYSYSDKTNIGNIQGGESKTASFYIDLDDTVQAGTYKTELIIKYSKEDEKEINEKKISFNIDVKNKPTFEVLSTEYDKENIKPGDELTAKVKVKNIGSKKAEFVSIRAFKESSQPFDFEEKSDYIGTLEPGEEGEGVLLLTVDKDAEQKKYLIDYEIRSIDQDEVFIQEETMQLIVDGEEKKTDIFPIIIFIILGIVVIGGAYYLGKNDGFKKKNK